MTALIKLDHIQLAIPADSEDLARKFFGTILGMVEITKPKELAARGGCWFRTGTFMVHLGVEKNFKPAMKAHPALCVENLQDMAETLPEAGYPVEWDRTIEDRQHFYSKDPFGNRIEFIQDGDGFMQR